MFQFEDVVRRVSGARRPVATVVSRTVSISGQETTISIEEIFWLALRRMASRKGIRMSSLIAHIEEERAPGSTISSSIRVYVLMHACGRLIDTLDCTIEEIVVDLLGDMTVERDAPALAMKQKIKRYRELLKVVTSEAKRTHICNAIAIEEADLRSLRLRKKHRHSVQEPMSPPA
jgi:predicted DNA-binding ribbon-helix-helix protein